MILQFIISISILTSIALGFLFTLKKINCKERAFQKTTQHLLHSTLDHSWGLKLPFDLKCKTLFYHKEQNYSVFDISSKKTWKFNYDLTGKISNEKNSP